MLEYRPGRQVGKDVGIYGRKVGTNVSIYKWQWDGCGKDTGDHRDTHSGKDGNKEHSKIIMISMPSSPALVYTSVPSFVLSCNT
jgi:hypothetical protein